MLWEYRIWKGYYLSLKLELASVIAEKVNDIFLYCTADVNFDIPPRLEENSGNGMIPIPQPWHWESPIHLNQQSCYHHEFTEKFIVNSWNDLITVSVTVRVVMLRYTLNIIDEVKVPTPVLGNELGGLLAYEVGEKKNKFTDVTFAITTKSSSHDQAPSTFYAHKAVLAARSPVFAKMFEHDLQESATNSVVLSDITPPSFQGATHLHLHRQGPQHPNTS